MEKLSIEAKVMLGGFFGIMITDELYFKRPHIMTEKSRKGLDELVEQGWLTVDKKRDGLVWKPTDKLKKERPQVSLEFIKEHNFKLTTE